MKRKSEWRQEGKAAAPGGPLAGAESAVSEGGVSLILAAVKLAAEKHGNQRRKSAEATPYINHPLEVAELLWRVGEVRDTATLLAALLHDTIEDTDTRPEEIRRLFGEETLSLVLEVTDDKGLPKAERKRRQVEGAFRLSQRARQIVLADKICNLRDLIHSPPKDWPEERKREYLDWTKRVVAGLRGHHHALELCYDELAREAEAKIPAPLHSSS